MEEQEKFGETEEMLKLVLVRGTQCRLEGDEGDPFAEDMTAKEE